MSELFRNELILLKTNAFSINFTQEHPTALKYNVKISSPKLEDTDLEEGEIDEQSTSVDPSEYPFIVNDYFVQKISEKKFKHEGIPLDLTLDQQTLTIFSPKTIDKCDNSEDQDQIILEEWTESDNRKFLIDIRISKEVDLRSKSDATAACLDSVIRHRAKTDMVACGQYYYRHRVDDDSRIQLTPIAEMATGIFLSGVRMTMNGPIIVIDRCESVVTKEGKLTDFLHQNVFSSNPGKRHCPDLSLCQLLYNDVSLNRFLTDIVGFKCQVSYLGYTKKFKVKGVSKLSASKTMFFWTEHKKEISIEEYFLRRYSIKLRYPNLPCLISGSDKRPVHYPIELCAFFSDARISQNQIRSELAHTLTRVKQELNPSSRFNYCLEAASKFKSLSSGHFELHHIDLDTRPLVTLGRIARTPQIDYVNEPVEPINGRWRPQHFISSQRLNNWFVINTSKNVRLMSEIEVFIDALIDYARRFNGLVIFKPQVLDYSSMHPNNIAAKACIECLHKTNRPIGLLLFIIDEKGPLYPSIHYACDVMYGIRATCLLAKNIRPNAKSRGGSCGQRYQAAVLQTLSHKINARLGGVNNKIKVLSRSFFDLMSAKTMFVGCDVSHSDLQLDSSVAACVASIGDDLFRYESNVQLQAHSNEEIIGMIDQMIEGHLMRYESQNGRLPARIVVYRDGVSQQQFDAVREKEIRKIDDVFERLYKPRAIDRPKLVFIVVQKRHRLRFFYDAKDKGPLRNPPPGTIVDDKVTSESNLDFYLMSHSNNKGTSRPAHYHILRNDTVMTLQELQHLSFMLCHLYARCAASISIPAPVMYAHLAAYRMRMLLIGSNQKSRRSGSEMSTIEGQNSCKIAASLENTMYFC